jgi:hypothetical protein
MFIEKQSLQISDVERFIRQTDANARQALVQVSQAHAKMFRECWDESKVTAQAKCDFLGQNAYKLFASSKATQEYLYAWLKNYVPLSIPANRDAVINEDGTVTIKFKKLVDGEIVWSDQNAITPNELKTFDDEVKEWENR